MPVTYPISLHTNRNPRSLHSFPTRRSSDLLLLEQNQPDAALLNLLQAAEIAPQESRDRKSTRLNSSHTVISYAVFCLKKKTTHETKASYDDTENTDATDTFEASATAADIIP